MVHVQKTIFTHTPSTTITTGAHLTPTNYTNSQFTGIRLHIDISAFSGTSITFTLQGVDPVSGDAYTVLASAAKSSAAPFTLTVAPGIAATANVSANEPAPYRWNLVTTGTITSVTYSVRCEYFNC